MKRLFILVILFSAKAAAQPLSERLAATVTYFWPDSMALKKGPATWTYDQGVILKGFEQLWKNTGKGEYFNYIQKSMDFFVQKDGSIRTYKADAYNLDNVNCGRNLLLLLNTVNDNQKYVTAVQTLREQLRKQPRTAEGGFWHKKIYPSQMWLDGLYMAEPFYAEYGKRFNDAAVFDDIANQFIWMEKHARDPKTGLLYHAWDESKTQQWADKTTGCSPNFWGRAMGWYGMALADVLEIFPADHPKRAALVAILDRYAAAVSKVQDGKTGVWWQVLDRANDKGNYLEASASSMFVYTLAKASRLGLIGKKYYAVAKKGYDGILATFISTDKDGHTHLNKVCQVAGLGGNPYRDGSYAYYIGEPVISDDPKGLGACLLAATEIEGDEMAKPGLGKKVLLDNYFNSEKKLDKLTGLILPFHYKWEELQDGGFSFLGNIFRSYGVNTATLDVGPTKLNLRGTDMYIIPDPDYPKENPIPNYIEPEHIKVITDWVKQGGVLIMLMNDTGNVEFEHANRLAKNFGIHFNEDSRNLVEGKNFEVGRLAAPPTICTIAKNIYMKQICTIGVTPPAVSILNDKGDVIMAVAKLGKGTVFAVGDPWFYNEYTDGRKLPALYQNFTAAQEWVQWLIKQVRKK